MPAAPTAEIHPPPGGHNCHAPELLPSHWAQPITPPPPKPFYWGPGTTAHTPTTVLHPGSLSPLCALKIPIFCNPLQWSHLRVRRWLYLLSAPQGPLQASLLHSLAPYKHRDAFTLLLLRYTALSHSSPLSYSHLPNTSSHPRTLGLVH